MLITSSRKPSDSTRILCKKLAVFFDCHYMTRGKMSLSEVLEEGRENIILLVGEFHGNPGSLSFYGTDGSLYLSLHISQTSPSPLGTDELKKGQIGLSLSENETSGDAERLYRVIADTVFEGFIPDTAGCGRLLTVSSDALSFSVRGTVFLKLYIKGMKIYGTQENDAGQPTAE
ncbi:hypothetical protein J5839_01750 [Methanosarcinaceae archaeon]|nr:hypothetical protein [Methanosarcinaceae archaeon]